MKDDERKFFITCLEHIDTVFARDIIDILSEFINYKRCWYLLTKWSNRGFYEYGTVPDLGWFKIEKFRGEYLKIYNEIKQKQKEMKNR